VPKAVRQGTTHDPSRSEVGYGEKVSPRISLKRLQERIRFAVRHSDTECARRTEFFAFERVVSCGSRNHWWRTELDLSSGEPLDDLHGSATVGTAIKIRSVFGGGSVLFRWWLWGCAQQLKAKRQKSGAPPVGQKAEMSDAHETLRKDVQ
jgi:hypothetical protein